MGHPDGPQGPPSPAREKQTRGTETSKYPEEEKATAIPLVAASERGAAQTGGACTPGGGGPRPGGTTPSGIPSTAGHVQSCVKLGGPPSKAKHSPVTDSAPVP